MSQAYSSSLPDELDLSDFCSLKTSKFLIDNSERADSKIFADELRERLEEYVGSFHSLDVFMSFKNSELEEASVIVRFEANAPVFLPIITSFNFNRWTEKILADFGNGKNKLRFYSDSPSTTNIFSGDEVEKAFEHLNVSEFKNISPPSMENVFEDSISTNALFDLVKNKDTLKQSKVEKSYSSTTAESIGSLEEILNKKENSPHASKKKSSRITIQKRGGFWSLIKSLLFPPRKRRRRKL